MSPWLRWVIAFWMTVIGSSGWAYPLYGSDDRAIRRLEADRLIHAGVVSGRQKLPGELLPIRRVDTRLGAYQTLGLPSANPELSEKIKGLLAERAEHYAIAILDLSEPGQPLYAAHQADEIRGLGSLGKVIAAMALFQALAEISPDDVNQRLRLLRETTVAAGELAVGDPHKVRFWDPVTRTLTRRALKADDHASLWEYLDWMLSASSNAAANVVMQQAMLLNHFGRDYSASPEQADTLFGQSSEYLDRLFEQTFVQPLERHDLSASEFRQGKFFGRRLRELVPGGPSHASARGVLLFLLRLEQGLIVDSFSSTEIKRLLYVTERRVRYAASPALRESAVYFKSGSLYACEPEEGYHCQQFVGNKLNLMNSMAVIETPAGDPRHLYLVALMSNVLRRNSALDHQAIATRIHRLIIERSR